MTVFEQHMNHEAVFHISQIVYLKSDKEQREYHVTGILLRPNNLVSYIVSHCGAETYAYEFEISPNRDIVLATSN